MQVSGYRIVAIRASTNFVQETTVFRNSSRHGHPTQEAALQSTAKFDYSKQALCRPTLLGNRPKGSRYRHVGQL